jgi:hypothetical protein
MTSLRNILVVVIAATLLAAATIAVAAARKPDTRLRVGKGIGAARVGMTAPQVRKALHTRPSRPVTSSNPEGRYRVRRAGVIVVEYNPETLRAVLISTRSKRFHYRALQVGASRATVYKRLAGKGWRRLVCNGTELEIAYYPGRPIDDPRGGTAPTARAQLSLQGHERLREMTTGLDIPVLSSPKCDDTAL